MHSNILMHHSLDKSMAFLLANKLASRTLLSTQLQRLFNDAYTADPVSPRGAATAKRHCGYQTQASQALLFTQLQRSYMLAPQFIR